MTKRYVVLKVKDIVGPLPDGRALIVLTAGGKVFPIRCSLADGAACYAHTVGSPFDSPYVFLSSSLRTITEIRVKNCVLSEVEGQPYGLSYFTSPKWVKILRKSSDSAAEALNLSLASGEKFLVEKETFEKIIDSSDAFACLKGSLGKFKEQGGLWNLAPLTNTDELKALDDYIDKAMPNGSIFRTNNAKA